MSGYNQQAFLSVPEPGDPLTIINKRPLFKQRRSALQVFSWACLVFICFIVLCPPPSWPAIVAVDIIHSQDKYPAGGSYPIAFRIRISKSWYIHGTTSNGDIYLPTVLSFKTPAGIKIEGVRFPSPEKLKFEYEDNDVDLYSCEVLVRATLNISKKARPDNLTIDGELSYQACTSQYCMPPENIPVPILIPIAPQGIQTSLLNQDMFERQTGILSGSIAGLKENAGFWLILLGIFLGGLALNLTPCIYPLIPITVSYFGGMSSQIKGRAIVHGILYIAGLSITNSLLGLIASLTGSMLGTILQNPIVLVIVSGILLFLALSFFDIWELQLPLVLTRMASMSFGGYFGTFFMGLTLGIVAAPCLGPFMLGLLTCVAQKGDPFLGFLYFFVLSIGLGLPLAILAIFSGTLKKLPMSGEWLRWIRKILGWILVIMAFFILLPLISEPSAKTTLISIVVVAAGVHLGWIEKSQTNSNTFRYIKKSTGYILIFGAIALFSFSIPKQQGVQWVPYDAGMIEDAAKRNMPVILDFYADWCSPCKALDKKVFRDMEVVELSRQVIPIRVDLTTRHPQQDELQRRYNIWGVPTIIFIDKDGIVKEDLRIESFVGRDEVISRMKRLINGPA
jgi:thiol:disulfide interchange protein DsbD